MPEDKKSIWEKVKPVTSSVQVLVMVAKWHPEGRKHQLWVTRNLNGLSVAMQLC